MNLNSVFLLAVLCPATSFLIRPANCRSAPVFHDGTKTRRAQTSELLYAKGDENEHRGASELTWDGTASSLQHVAPMPALMVEIEDDWKEWHYSFSRNGYTDFLPQFSPHLNCLMVGGANDSRLPWQEEPHAKITNMLFCSESGNDQPRDAGNIYLSSVADVERENRGLPPGGDTNPPYGQLAATLSESLSWVDGGDDEEVYDCILDRGLMNSIISSVTPNALQESPTTVLELHSLMREASRAIREHGIYVVITDQLLSDHAKDYLNAIGENIGMQWKFDLDGISSDEGISVSVARKYFTGELPSFGRLANINDDSDFSSIKHLLKP